MVNPNGLPSWSIDVTIDTPVAHKPEAFLNSSASITVVSMQFALSVLDPILGSDFRGAVNTGSIIFMTLGVAQWFFASLPCIERLWAHRVGVNFCGG